MFYRTVVQIEMLSRDMVPATDLTTIIYEITEGDCSGAVQEVSREEVDGPTMAHLLRAQGSAPEFLGLTHLGQEDGDG